jgi:hypothetical protein
MMQCNRCKRPICNDEEFWDDDEMKVDGPRCYPICYCYECYQELALGKRGEAKTNEPENENENEKNRGRSIPEVP